MRFLRQYLAFAKKIAPALTLSAAQYLAERYTELRSQNLQELAEQDLARVRSLLKLEYMQLIEYCMFKQYVVYNYLQLIYLNFKDPTCNCAHSRNAHSSGHFTRSCPSLPYSHEARRRSRLRPNRICSLQGGSLYSLIC